MNLNEFNSFSLHDAVHFHEELNPELFQGDKLIPQVREQLLLIAEDFMIHLDVFQHIKKWICCTQKLQKLNIKL